MARLAWAVLLCLPCSVITLVWPVPTLPGSRRGDWAYSRRQGAFSRNADLLCLAPPESGAESDDLGADETLVVRRSPPAAEPARKVSPLIASLLEDAPVSPVRQTLSAGDMAELTAAAAGGSEEGLRDQRRRAALAIVSPLAGAVAFAYSRSNPADPVALLRGMESRSPTLQAALESSRPTVVEFYAQWCKDCKAMASSVDKLERQFDGKVNFVVLDAERDENQKLVGLFRVDAIPHFAFISPDRKLLTTLTGFVILSARVIFYACMCISSYAHSLRHACKRMLVKLSARSAAHELTYGLGCSCASVCALDMCQQKQWQRN